VHATLNARPILIVALARHDGKRRVEEIVEVQRQVGTARPTIEPLFECRGGALIRLTGLSPTLRARLATAGALPKEMF